MLPISHILPRACAMYPHRLAVWDGEARLTFEELGRRVDALAGALKAQGLEQGDRVALLDVNSHRYAEAYYACAQAGMVFVPLNSRLALPELKYILNDCGAKALLLSDPFFPDLRRTCRTAVDARTVRGLRQGPLSQGRDRLRGVSGQARRRYDDRRKSISRRLCANLLHQRHHRRAEGRLPHLWQHDRERVRFASSASGSPSNDIWLHAAPMFHLVDAWSIWSLPLIGAPQVVVHFTPERFHGGRCSAPRPPATGLPPTLINMMAEHPKIGELRSHQSALHHVRRLADAARHSAEGGQDHSDDLHPWLRHHRDIRHHHLAQPGGFLRRGTAGTRCADRFRRPRRPAHRARDRRR